ncbi:uncharacterized protein BO97DRAFT_405120 [Aspergillus homomorphus CBS 101889]|uniref:BTB domain-containing protein n=1 Tax=Aspergillus homomorphus (strain CBS 101889) TaxID=1450537 RepID=A0A395I2P2_ASPHC|nr:hypothetical protein BO97DRAFT_405120 [Aspergillus homomorphus CBS 101889]RAL12834.1 hypothetical protein BO97DRAFT_405120 [Aspergillus homomorphus CBS 101889]
MISIADISEASATEFVKSVLSLYHGPCVKIRINPGNNEYTVSKQLLCRDSEYFQAMFTGEFKEKQEQTAILEEVEGVVSAQSLEALLQWIYIRRVKFNVEVPEDQISAAIELARFADMCTVACLEFQMAQQIKEILKTNPHPKPVTGKYVNRNTYCLTTEHIRSATFLPEGHAVRQVLAAASAEGFFRDKNHKFKEEVQAYPTFGADVLQEVRKALDTLNVVDYGATVEGSISGERVRINWVYDY